MNDRIIRMKDLPSIVGLSRSSVWRLEKAGHFPPRRKLGANSVGWLHSDIQAWMLNRATVPLRSRDDG